MRTGAAAGHSGYFHQAMLYDADDDLLAVAVPFLHEGAEAGEPTVVALGQRTTDLLRSEVGTGLPVTYVPSAEQYERPARAIRTYEQLFERLTADGATQIRVVGEVPHPGVGASWEEWGRYEATINRAFEPHPVWGLCTYDTRITPEEVLDDVARTHPHLAKVDGTHVVNPRYEDPARFLHGWGSLGVDPIEASTPLVELTNPSPAAARAAVAQLGQTAPLDELELEDLVVAVSEVVTNAVLHGVPPVVVRAWRAPGRVVVAVTDLGAGPQDPFAGLVPARRDGAPGGLGLWITHQTCAEVTFGRHPGGFTIRLAVGQQRPA